MFEVHDEEFLSAFQNLKPVPQSVSLNAVLVRYSSSPIFDRRWLSWYDVPKHFRVDSYIIPIRLTEISPVYIDQIKNSIAAFLSTDKKKRIALTIFLAVWLAVQCFFGNFAYVGIVLAFALVVICFRRQTWLALSLAVLGILLLQSPVISIWGQLLQSNLKAWNNPSVTLSTIYNSAPGGQVLPKQTRQVLAILQNQKIPDYQISARLHDSLVQQRIIESTWPLKMEPTSHYYFVYLDEASQYPNCTVVDQKRTIALVQCP
jgi:hypothetical protein